MADIRPFCGIRPKEGLEDKIASLPYDVFNREEARRKVQDDPYSFLRIDRPETQFPKDFDMYAQPVYEKAHDMLWKMIKDGAFVQDTTPCYYIYEQVMNGRSQTGITAVSSVDDYMNNIIKKHENTREDKELDRIRHVDACDAQTGPIFLAYRKSDVIENLIHKQKEEKPVYDFTSEDQIRHIVWIMKDMEKIKIIQDEFSKIQDIYIADGHHRCASAVKVALKRRAQKKQYSGEEEFNFFLSVLFADEQLMIMDYNRVLKDLNGNSEENVIAKLKDKFEMTKTDREGAKPKHKAEFGMYLNSQWYLLKCIDQIPENPVERLDVSILQNQVLEPIFGIHDPKTDHRIDFVGGIRGMEELEKRAGADCKAAFAMFPTSISELFHVADAGQLMPPKSTWFEPKLRSGLLIHSIKE